MLNDAAYHPQPGRYDEAIADDGTMRPAWAGVGSALADMRPIDLLDRQRQADRLLDAEGAGHLVHDLLPDDASGIVGSGGSSGSGGSGGSVADSRPWRLDPLPLVIAHDEFRQLTRAAAQRVRVLEAVLADLYGPRRLVRSGVLPAEVLFAIPSLRTTVATHAASRWLVHYAVDLVRLADGSWRVVQDSTDAPSGAGYAMMNRSVVARVMPDTVRRAGVAPVNGFAAVMRRALAAQSPVGRRSPRTVVLTGGPTHPTYVEHSYLAVQLGYHLAEGGDLVVRKNRVWMRALDGMEPVDVIYRRLEDAGLDPLDARTVGGAGIPGVTWAAQSGGVSLANAFGTRLAEEPALVPYLPAAAAELLGETLDLAALAPTDDPASAPCLSSWTPGALVPGTVVLRMHLAVTPDGVTAMDGGVGRVLAPGDDPRLPTARVVKDVWVVGGPAPTRLVTRSVQTRVDFGASVPKRAADALYWMGRAAERAEVVARTTRLVAAQVQQDPSLLSVAGGGWGTGAIALLRAAQGLSTSATDGRGPNGAAPLVDRVQHELQGGQQAVAAQLASLVHEAMTVREFLSTTTGRVLGRLARLRADLVSSLAAPDDLDVVLVDLAALAGLAMESTVRGPAWRFLDLARRLERALALLGSIEAALGIDTEPLALQPLAESLLAANESLVAYRRRYRSDVELGDVVDLLVHDDANPRSLAFQLDRLREHMASLAWQEGADLVQQASLGALTHVDDAVVGGRHMAVDALVLATRGPLLQLGDAVVRRWFADPVNPMMMGNS
ncbi:MAG: circularly permuted type 2 ATP-grasp protein [Acidimicrobiales bacterium]|nr:circularly permuted type 2 ATP-grasp protein [Acidimicrobiales bacterium]MCB9393037.1 circularly permuted type 2 ATP-grasp protein [Acidimicrobiaceae bacterium]